MKIILSILSVITMITIFSLGAFVPATEDIGDTVAGLVTLSDAEMEQ